MFYKPYLIWSFQQPYNVGTIISQILKAGKPKFRSLSSLSKIIQLGVSGAGTQLQACLAPQPAFLFSGVWLLLQPCLPLLQLSHHRPRSLPPSPSARLPLSPQLFHQILRTPHLTVLPYSKVLSYHTPSWARTPIVYLPTISIKSKFTPHNQITLFFFLMNQGIQYSMASLTQNKISKA